MEKRPKVGFWTKLKANKQFLYEIPIEGNPTDKILTGFNDVQYAAQVIRAGNCLSKINPIISNITVDSFWNTSHFEELAQTVYWTFNEGFRLNLIEKMKELPISNINYCIQKLQDNLTPYEYYEKPPEFYDEEIVWAIDRDKRMRKDPEFQQIYALDKANRRQILDALNNILINRKPETKAPGISYHEVPFPEMLKSLPNEVDTLNFIKQKLKEAHFRFDIFKKVTPRETDGKNPTYFNGCIAAMVGFFYDHKYFYDKFSERDIFYAYQKLTKNKIGKLNAFLSKYRKAPGYEEGYDKLKLLKIKDLK